MKPVFKAVFVLLVILTAGWIITQKNRSQTANSTVLHNKNETAVTGTISPGMSKALSQAKSATLPTIEPEAGIPLPQLIDLGADKCIPCKAMAPILEELRQNYAGRMNVRFIDVWKNPDAGQEFSIRMIPTQIFIDAKGNELFRHEGFFSRADILSKWQELGIDLGSE